MIVPRKPDLDPKRRKQVVRVVTRQRIRRGLIERQACWCGHPKAEAHYLDYRDPEKVVFLCNRHHRQWHQADRLHRALGLPILRQVLTELAQEAACAATALVKAQQPGAAAA